MFAGNEHGAERVALFYSLIESCHLNDVDPFSGPSVDFLALVADIEHYLVLNYNDESGPVQLFKTLDRTKLSGQYQNTSERQLQILRGALISCKNSSPTNAGNKRKIKY